MTIGPSVGLLTSNNKVSFITGDIKAFTIDPNGLNGHYYLSFTYSTPVSVQLSEQNNTMTVRFINESRNIDAAITLTKNNTYSRTSSLTKLAAIWNDDYYTTFGTWNFNINNDGSFNASSSSSICAITGQFSTINQSVNEYEVTMTVTNCSTLAGSYTGIAYTADTDVTDDTLVIITTNGATAGARALGFKARRQP
ncbi:MAG: hypothetical protein OQL06_14525 [Gammaproteobacteria bacterium]|nr:hypothetical protein [Gammaproteobacteria bacterium]